jgi:hypothetical protein
MVNLQTSLACKDVSAAKLERMLTSQAHLCVSYARLDHIPSRRKRKLAYCVVLVRSMIKTGLSAAMSAVLVHTRSKLGSLNATTVSSAALRLLLAETSASSVSPADIRMSKGARTVLLVRLDASRTLRVPRGVTRAKKVSSRILQARVTANLVRQASMATRRHLIGASTAPRGIIALWRGRYRVRSACLGDSARAVSLTALTVPRAKSLPCQPPSCALHAVMSRYPMQLRPNACASLATIWKLTTWRTPICSTALRAREAPIVKIQAAPSAT